MGSKVSLKKSLSSLRKWITSSHIFFPPDNSRLVVTASQWLDRIMLGLIAAVILYWLEPLLYKPMSALAKLPLWQLCIISAFGGWTIATIQDRFSIRLRRKQLTPNNPANIKATLLYPPLHVAVFVGSAALIINGFTGFHSSGADLLLLCFVVTFSYTLTIIAMQQNNEPLIDKKVGKSIDIRACSDTDFRDWLENEKPSARLDFFNRNTYIKRMLARITAETDQSGRRGQILYGEFGSGKSTLLEFIYSELKASQPDTWIISTFDCWGRSDDSKELDRLLLTQVVDDIGKHIEATSLHSVPSEYVEAAYGISPWFKLSAPFISEHAPDAVLRRINKLLKRQNLKLLLVVENIDRSPSVQTLVSSVAAMLDKMSDLDSVRFIFTGSQNSLPLPIVARIADYTESLSSLLPDQVIGKFLQHCLHFSFDNARDKPKPVIPYLIQNYKASDPHQVLCDFGLINNEKSGINTAKTETEQLLDALTACLSNPRMAKIVFRYVFDRWQTIEGEVHLLDLLIYATAIHDGEISEKIAKLKKQDKAYFTEENDPFKKGYKASSRLEKAQAKEEGQPVIHEASLDLDHYGNIIAYYIEDCPKHGALSFYPLHYLQPIRTKYSDSNKYLNIVNSGSSDGYPSDQFLLRNLKAISEGNTDALEKILCDQYLELDKGYIYDLLKSMVDTHWQSLDPIIEITKAIITYRGDTSQHSYKSLRSNVFNVLFDHKPESEAPTDFDDCLKETAKSIHRALEATFSTLFQEGRYSQLAESLWSLLVNRQSLYFDGVLKPLILKFYSTEAVPSWVATYRSSPEEKDAVYNYFRIASLFTGGNSALKYDDTDTKLVICETLLSALYLLLHQYIENIESFYRYCGHRSLLPDLADVSHEVKDRLSENATSVLKTIVNFLEKNPD